jgi:hypothetical protein
MFIQPILCFQKLQFAVYTLYIPVSQPHKKLSKWTASWASSDPLMIPFVALLASQRLTLSWHNIVGRRYTRFPSVGLFMEASKDNEVHNNLASTWSCMLSKGWWVIVQRAQMRSVSSNYSAVERLYRAVQSLLCIVHSIGSNNFGWGIRKDSNTMMLCMYE